MATRRIRIGLVGCGRLAAAGYVPALDAFGGADLVAVADPVPERARGVATSAVRGGRPASVHAGIEELLAATTVDAVVVATPAERHVRDAAAAAAEGIACLVEKPPAVDVAGAAALAELAPAPWIGFNRRFEPGRELLARIPSGGELELVLELRYRRASWRPHSSHGDALLDLGPHLVDLALILTASERAAIVAADVRERRAELVLETDRGPARLRCATDLPYRERVEVRRPGGDVVARWRRGGLGAGLADRLRRRDNPLVRSLARQLAALATVAAGGEPGLLASAADGVRTMRVIEAARRSPAPAVGVR